MHVEPLPDTQSRDREGAVAAQVRLIRQRPRSPFWLRLARVRDELFPIRPAGIDPLSRSGRNETVFCHNPAIRRFVLGDIF